MADLWQYDEPIRTYIDRAEKATGELLDLTPPVWIDQDITPATVAAIIQGGCASGAYMPAVTYREALATMNERGDAIWSFLASDLGEGHFHPLLNERAGCADQISSWAALARYYVSSAVELWAANVESELSDLLDGIEEGEAAEEEPDGPQDGDYTIGPSGPLGSRYAVGVVGGKFIGEFADQDAAEAAIRERMLREGYWPDAWVVSDHGNAERIDLGEPERVTTD